MTCLVSLSFLDFGVEIKRVNELRLLAGKDGADLRLEQAQLASVYQTERYNRRRPQLAS
jgi:hypothetical protein